jgi:hypothetical protein
VKVERESDGDAFLFIHVAILVAWPWRNDVFLTS